MSEPLVPLWTDENITNDARRATSSPTEQAKIRSCLLFMRHGYEAERAKDKQRIQELEAELARLRELVQWEPVDNWEMLMCACGCGRRIEVHSAGIKIIDTDDERIGVELDPDQYRLCRRNADA